MENLSLFIIIPVYNVEKYLDRCLLSFINQTYKNFIIFAIDDGSTDSSGKILDTYAEKYGFIRVVHQTNQSLFLARKTGLIEIYKYVQNNNLDPKYCYVLYCDSDDWFEKNALEICQNKIINNYPDMIIFSYQKIIENTLQKVNGDAMDLYVDDKEKLLSICLEGKFGYMWLKCHKLSIVDLEIFNAPYRITLCEDTLHSYMLFNNAKNCLFIPNILYNYWINNNSLTKKGHFFHMQNIDAYSYPYIYVYNHISLSGYGNKKALANFIYNKASYMIQIYRDILFHEKSKEHKDYLLSTLSSCKYVNFLYIKNNKKHFPLINLIKKRHILGRINIIIWLILTKLRVITRYKENFYE